MTLSATAEVPTEHAVRYMTQLGKHWSHSLAVDLAGDTASITFPADARGADWPAAAVITLRATDRALECRIDASAAGQLEGLKKALGSHLDRFAFREAPLPFEWCDQG